MKTDFMVLTFNDQGEVEALHRDQFNLGFLGKQKIERASDIKFNEDTQAWTIWLLGKYGPMTNEAAEGFETYDQARDAEVAWLEYSAMNGFEPSSPLGIAALQAIRRVHAYSQNGTATAPTDPAT